DDQALLDDGVSRDVVAAAPDGDREGVLARKGDRRRHVSLVRAAHDEMRAPVDHAVEDTPRFVVRVFAGLHDRPRDLPSETPRRVCVHGGHVATATRDLDRSRGASEPTTAIRTAPATGGQNASATLPVASTSIPAESGPTKASREPAVYMTAEEGEASLWSRAINGGSGVGATAA